MKKVTLVSLVALALVVSSSIFAYASANSGIEIRVGDRWDRHRGRWGYPAARWRYHRPAPRFFLGGTIVVPAYPRYYYSAPPVVIQQQPPVYVQPKEEPSDYWYYCRDPEGFYPYIKSCPGGWLKVVPETTPPQQ